MGGQGGQARGTEGLCKPCQLREGLLGTRGQMPSTMCTLGGGRGPDSPQLPNSHTELSLSLRPSGRLCRFPQSLRKRVQAEQAALRFEDVVCLLRRAQPLRLQEGWLALLVRQWPGREQDSSGACLGRLNPGEHTQRAPLPPALGPG